MTASLLLHFFALAPTQEEAAPPPAPPPPPSIEWRVLTPFDASDVDELDAWWRAHAAELGASARFERAVALGAEQLEPGTLLLGFERGFLEELAADHALGSAVVPFALESWVPAWSFAVDESAPGSDGAPAETPEIDSFEGLLAPALRGRIHLRRITRDSSEGLILADVARRLDLVGADELRRLVLASFEGGTIHGANVSLDALLKTLPGGAATIAPVRSVARARRAGLKLSYSRPTEGFLSLELAAAATAETPAALLAWFDGRFHGEVGPKLAHALEFEPVGALPSDAPAWMRLVAGARSEVDRAAAGALRVRLAQDYEAEPPRSALADSDWLGDLIDTALLTAAAIAVLLLWRRERRRAAT